MGNRAGALEEEVVEEKEDAVADETIKEPDEAELDAEGNPVVDEEAEDGNDEKAAGEAEEDAGGELEEETDPRDAQIAELKARLEKIEKVPAREEKPFELTDEQWAKNEEDWGMDRKAIQRVTNQSMMVVQHITKMIDDRFAAMEGNKALETMSKRKGFEDTMKYQKDIGDFLKDYNPKFHSDQNLLEKAYYFARGKNSNGAIKKVIRSQERNRVIAGKIRSSASNTGGKSKSVVLSPAQKSAAKAAGMDEAEYIKWMRK